MRKNKINDQMQEIDLKEKKSPQLLQMNVYI